MHLDTVQLPCECGCGQMPNYGRRFIWGHNYNLCLLSEKSNKKRSKTMSRLYKEGKLPYLTTKGLKRPDICGDNNPARRPEVRKKIIEGLMGRIVTLETRQKLREAKKDKIIIPRKIRFCKCGCSQSFECLTNSKRKYMVGHNNKDRIMLNRRKTYEELYGKEKAENIKFKCRLSHKGQHNSPATEFKKGNMSGELNPKWKGGITPLHIVIRCSEKYKIWQGKVFQRDGWTCQTCSEKSHGDIVAHHIKPLRQILKENNIARIL